MAGNERTTDLILRAQVDQALLPLAQVSQRVKDLITVLDAQREATKKGDTTLTEYAKALRDVEKVSGDLLRQRALLDSFEAQTKAIERQQEVVEKRQASRAKLVESFKDPSAPLDKEIAALGRRDEAVSRSVSRLDTLRAKYQNMAEVLQQMGVLTDALAASEHRLDLERAHARISENVRTASDALAAGRETSDTLITTLRRAGAEKQAQRQRELDAERAAAAQTKAIMDTVNAASRAAAENEKERTNLVRAARTAENEAARREATELKAADDARAAEKVRNAAAFRAEQSRLAEAVRAVWEAEDTAAAKARASLESFRSEVSGVAAAARAHAVGQAGALGRSTALPAPTLAATVSAALATPSGPGVGLGDPGKLSAEVAELRASIVITARTVADYTDKLKRLDAVTRELGRQSQIIDGFERQRTAAVAAATAVRDASAELVRLGAAAKTAGSEAELSEVASKIAAVKRRLGSVEEGTGLFGNARATQEAFAREAEALRSIGLTADMVGSAMTRLTTIATETSKLRTAMLDHERTALAAEADAVRNRVAGLSTSPGATAPTARGAVASVAGATVRGAAEITDTAKATAELEAVMAKGRFTAQSFNSAMDRLFAISAQIAKDASLIDQFNAQREATSRLFAEFRKAEDAVRTLATAVKAGTASLNELHAAEARATGLAAELQKQGAAQTQLGAQLKSRRIDTANLDAETAKLVATTQRLATAQSGASANGSRLFGLSSYQTQNLLYQANDVVTQLSLGQSVFQTFASQAGQIFQIFNISTETLKRFLLVAGPVALAVGAVALALLRMKDSADATRDFTHILTINVDGLQYQAKALTEVARVIEGYGVSFGDAKVAVQGFIKDGLTTDSMKQFAKTAADLADTTGIAFKDALKQIGVIATGSYDDIMKLNEALNFLSIEEQAAVKASFESENANTGRTVALNALTAAAARARAEGLSPFTQAAKDVTAAWHAFLDALIDTGALRAVSFTLQHLANGIRLIKENISYVINGSSADTANGTATRISEISDRLKRVQGLIDQLKASGQAVGSDTMAALIKQAQEYTDKLHEAKLAQYNLTIGAPSPTPEKTGTGYSGVETGPLPTAFRSLPPPNDRINKTIPPDMQATIAAVSDLSKVGIAELNAIYRNEAWQAGVVNGKSTFKDGPANWTGQNAVGAFQLLPETFAGVVKEFKTQFEALAQVLGKPISIHDNDFNALAGALYYKKQAAAFGSPALGAAAYNAGPGTDNPDSDSYRRGVKAYLGGRAPVPIETAQYVANFLARNPGSEATSGVTSAAEVSARNNQYQRATLDELQKRRIAAENTLLRGAEREAADAAKVEQFRKEQNLDANRRLNNAPQTPEITAEINRSVAEFSKKLADQRDKEIQDANKALQGIVKSAQDAADRFDKSNPAAQRAIVDRSYDDRLEAINIQIRNGATGAVLGSLNAAKDALLRARDKERENVTVQVDRAVVDDIVKTRDELVTATQNDMKAGVITISEGFNRIRKIVSEFSPRIKTAVSRANEDLLRQPQTPQIQEQVARNTKVSSGADDRKAFADADKTALERISQLIGERNAKVQSYNELVSQGAITQREADARSIKAYDDSRPRITGLTEELKKQIDLQLKQGLITPEVYGKMSADLERVTAQTNSFTASEIKLGHELENSIINHAVQGFTTITDAIGGAVAGTKSWGDVLRSVGVGFAQFAAGVLRDIGAMILKQTILNALQSAGGGAGIIKSVGGFLGLGGTAAGAATGAVSSAAGASSETLAGLVSTVSLLHTGGIVGSSSMSRGVNPAMFVSAPRFHSGGLVGLAPGEMPIIAKKGEEVLTEADSRHSKNQQPGGGSEPYAIKNVVLFDQSEVAKSMGSAAGEKVVVAHIRRNAPAIRQLLGVR